MKTLCNPAVLIGRATRRDTRSVKNPGIITGVFRSSRCALLRVLTAAKNKTIVLLWKYFK
jgi:hypothetical protein